MNELTKWDQANAALFSVLFLITTGPAGNLRSKFESKLGKRANGQGAWRALLVKYENNSTQRRRTLMRKFDNSKMEDGKIQMCSSFKSNNRRMISKTKVSPFQSIE